MTTAEEIREATRSGNECLKDFRHAIREARELGQTMVADMSKSIDERRARDIEEATRDADKCLKEFQHAIRDARELGQTMVNVMIRVMAERYDREIEKSTARVIKRFDDLAEVLLGVKRPSRDMELNLDSDLKKSLPPFPLEQLAKLASELPQPILEEYQRAMREYGAPGARPILEKAAREAKRARERADSRPEAIVKEGSDGVVHIMTPRGEYNAANVEMKKPPPYTGEHCWIFTAFFLHPNPWDFELVVGPDNIVNTLTLCRYCKVEWFPSIDLKCPGGSDAYLDLHSLSGE